MQMNDIQNGSPERFFPDPAVGLNHEQVAFRREQGLDNSSGTIRTLSEKQIILKNIITPFNILNFILAGMILAVGSFKNMLFMGVILCNILIGSFQEIRAKRTIDKLSLIAAPRAHVIREGETQEIPVEEIVLDDILLLSAGGQVCADCLLVEGECEVNESLLTGESDPIVKKPGDLLLSGSFLVSGACRAKVEHVGAENYANKITSPIPRYCSGSTGLSNGWDSESFPSEFCCSANSIFWRTAVFRTPWSIQWLHWWA